MVEVRVDEHDPRSKVGPHLNQVPLRVLFLATLPVSLKWQKARSSYAVVDPQRSLQKRQSVAAGVQYPCVGNGAMARDGGKG